MQPPNENSRLLVESLTDLLNGARFVLHSGEPLSEEYRRRFAHAADQALDAAASGQKLSLHRDLDLPKVLAIVAALRAAAPHAQHVELSDLCRQLVGALEVSRTSFQDVGFPERCTIVRVTISEAARTIVVQIQLRDDPRPRRRLYARTFDEETYTPLVPREDDCDDSDPTPCPVSGYVYFNRMVWNQRGGNWGGLFRVHCASRSMERLLGRAPGSAEWISQILGVSGDGARLFVVAASEDSDDPAHPIRYSVAALDVGTRSLSPLSQLKGVFV